MCTVGESAHYKCARAIRAIYTNPCVSYHPGELGRTIVLPCLLSCPIYLHSTSPVAWLMRAEWIWLHLIKQLTKRPIPDPLRFLLCSIYTLAIPYIPTDGLASLRHTIARGGGGCVCFSVLDFEVVHFNSPFSLHIHCPGLSIQRGAGGLFQRRSLHCSRRWCQSPGSVYSQWWTRTYSFSFL